MLKSFISSFSRLNKFAGINRQFTEKIIGIDLGTTNS